MKLYLQVPPHQKTYTFHIPDRLVLNRFGFLILKCGLRKSVPAVRKLRYKMFRPILRCLRGFRKQGECLLEANLQNNVHISLCF